MSGIPSNAGPSPGTKNNVHLTHLSLCHNFTMYLLSCSVLDRLYVLSNIYLFIMALM